MEFFEPKLDELLNKIAIEYSISIKELRERYINPPASKKKTRATKKQPKPPPPEHNHAPFQTPREPCALCSTHGDITAPLSFTFVIA